MTKTISKMGNSQGIIFDTALMDLARLKVGDKVTVTIHEGGSIILTPVRPTIGSQDAAAAAKRLIKGIPRSSDAWLERINQASDRRGCKSHSSGSFGCAWRRARCSRRSAIGICGCSAPSDSNGETAHLRSNRHWSSISVLSLPKSSVRGRE